MKSKYQNILLGTILVLLLSSFSVFHFVIFDNARDFLGSVWFQKSVDVDELIKKYDLASTKQRYKRKGVKILIVPGHDNRSSGAQYKGIKESDMNVIVGEEIYKLLSNEKGVKPFLTRDSNGYNFELARYLEKEADEIDEFQESKKDEMRRLVRRGEVETYINIHHNAARPEVVNTLYGINKFANDNDFDIVMHLHFNDYPGRSSSTGKYSGFSIYIPEKQFSNSDASRDFAEKIREALSFWFAESDLKNEGGIVEDQELIAIGAYNTLDPISILIEYGYIYESRFHQAGIKEVIYKNLAAQTHIGIMNFLNERDFSPSEFYEFENYVWLNNFGEKKEGKDVLALQHFLRINDYYPLGGNLNRCPLNGNFGNCTKIALTEFQRDNGVNPTGFFGPQTRNLINNF